MLALFNRLEVLAQQMGSEKHYLNSHYYRVKKENSAIYKIACLVPDNCGSYLYNPQLTVAFSDSNHNELSAISSYNDFVTPPKVIPFSQESTSLLQKELLKLLSEIELALKQNQ